MTSRLDPCTVGDMKSNEFQALSDDPDFSFSDDYDETKSYSRYTVEPEFGDKWAVVRRNRITGQGAFLVTYKDEQVANHVAFSLNELVDREAKM